MRILVLFILCVPSVCAQEHRMSGVVINENTLEVVPYANISVLKSDSGVSSGERGGYTFDVSKSDFDKEVSISSLGYRTAIIPMQEFKKMDTLFLTPNIESLKEVVLSSVKEAKETVLYSVKKNDVKGRFTSAINPYMLGMFFPYKDEYGSVTYVSKVHAYLLKKSKQSSKFRLRVLTKGEDGLPDQDILLENHIVTISKGAKDVIVDLSKYRINIPEEGIYVAIEWLHIPFNIWNESRKIRNREGEKVARITTYYLPFLGSVVRDKESFKAAEFRRGAWQELRPLSEDLSPTGAPAISLTLSNE